MKKIATILFVAVALAACKEQANTGAQRETEGTKTLLNQAAVAVGLPGILNFTEKRQLKMLYELRDQADLATYSYYVDIQGRRHKICPTTSVGFGMPFSAQFTAPEVDRRSGQTTISTYQPEPNGLYMPDSTAATWVICLGDDGELRPVYVEPQIIVSLSPMSATE